MPGRKNVVYTVDTKDGRVENWTEEQFGRAKDKLYELYPDAEVVCSYDYDPNDKKDTSNYAIGLDDGRREVWTPEQFAEAGDVLLQKYKKAKIRRVQLYDYNADIESRRIAAEAQMDAANKDMLQARANQARSYNGDYEADLAAARNNYNHMRYTGRDVNGQPATKEMIEEAKQHYEDLQKIGSNATTDALSARKDELSKELIGLNTRQSSYQNSQMERYKAAVENGDITVEPEEWEGPQNGETNEEHRARLEAEIEELKKNKPAYHDWKAEAAELNLSGDALAKEMEARRRKYAEEKAEYDKKMGELEFEYNNNPLVVLDRQIEEAYIDLDGYDRALQEIRDKQDAIPSHHVPGEIINEKEMLRYSNKEYSRIMQAAADARERVHKLEMERDGTMNDVWKRLGSRAWNIDNWTFGLGALFKAGVVADAMKNQGDGYSKDVLKQASLRNIVEQEFMENSKATARWADMAGDMIPFILQMAAGGLLFEGAGKGLETAVRAGSNAFLKKVLGKVTKEATVAALTVNTVDLANTLAGILQRSQGEIIQNQDGTYSFKGGESAFWATWNTEAERFTEFFTERIGEHFGAGLKGLAATKIGKSVGLELGLNAVTKFLSREPASGFERGVRNFFRLAGIQNYPGEVIEEELGIVLTNLLQLNPAGIVKGFTDGKQQADIFGGLAFSIGAMQAVPITANVGVRTYNKIHSANLNTRLNRADAEAARVFGDNAATGGVWADLKDRIDNAANEDITPIVYEIAESKDMTNEEKRASLNYVDGLMRLRGFTTAVMSDMQQAVMQRRNAAAVDLLGTFGRFWTEEKVDFGADRRHGNNLLGTSLDARDENGKRVREKGSTRNIQYGRRLSFAPNSGMQFSDGFVVGEDEDRLFVHANDGNAYYVYKDGLEQRLNEGTATDSGKVPLFMILDEQAKRKEAGKERQRMMDDSKKNVANLYNNVVPGTKVNIGSAEAEDIATVQGVVNGQFVVVDSKGTERVISPKDMAGFMHMPYDPKTDAEINEITGRADEKTRLFRNHIDKPFSLNGARGYVLKGASYTIGQNGELQCHLSVEENGTAKEFVVSEQEADEILSQLDGEKANAYNDKIKKGSKLRVSMGGVDAVYEFQEAVMEDGEVVFKVTDPDTGQVVDITPDMVTNLDNITGGQRDAGNNPVPVTPPATTEGTQAVDYFDDPVANALGISKDYVYVTKKGNRVVDRQKLWNDNPELWARWYDQQPNKSQSTRDYLADKLKQADKEVEKARKDYAAEERGNQNPDTLESLQDALDEKVKRQQRIKNLFDKYDQAQKKAEEAAKQPAAPVQQAPAQPSTPVQQQQPQPSLAPKQEAAAVQMRSREELEKSIDDLDAAIRNAKSEAEYDALMEQKRQTLEEYYREIGTEQPIVVTRKNVIQMLKDAGYSDRLIQIVKGKLETSGCLTEGFRIGKQIVLIADDIRGSDRAQKSYVHERQHGITFAQKLAEKVLNLPGVTEEKLLFYVNKMAGGELYNNRPAKELADECISKAMEVAYNSTPEELADNLRQAGLDNEEIINFVKTLDDEQRRNGSQINRARRGRGRASYADGNSQELGTQNDGNSEPLSGRILGQERVGSDGSGTSGTGGAEVQGGQAGESGESGAELTSDISDDVKADMNEKGLVMDGGLVMSVEQSRLKQETGYKTPNEKDAGGNPIAGDIQFSVTTVDPWGKNYLSNKDARKSVVKSIENLVERMVTNELVYGVIPKGVYKYGEKTSGSKAGPLRTNQEYIVTFDIDTSCPRTLQYLAYVKRIEAKIGRPLTQTESIQLIEMMRAYGQNIPCVYCYCENKRQALKQYYTDFMTSRHKVISAKTEEEALEAMYGHSLSKAAKNSKDPAVVLNKAAYKVFQQWRKEKEYNPTLKQLWYQYRNDRNVALTILDDMLNDGRVNTSMSDEAITRVLCEDLRIADKGAQKSVEDIVSEWKWNRIEDRKHDDFTRIEDEDDLVVDPRTFSLWHDMTLYGKSASSAKNVLRYVPYTDELKTLSKKDRDFINGMGGLRMHSSNDFRIDYVLDYFQFMADMAVNKMFGHTYTKSPDFVRIFGKSGYKINMSIAAYEDSRGVRPNVDEGFDWKEARELKEMFPNAGIMMMATSDAQVQFILDNDWIDMGIPFHASGLPKAVWYDMRAWTDYSAKQNERFLNAEEMKAELKADGVEIPKGAKADVIEKMYIDHFNIRVERYKTGKDAGKRIAPHFLPGKTVVDGVEIPGHNNDYQTYINLCRQYGVRPRFYGMKVKDNTPEGGGREVDISEHPQYMKFIKETARTDTPQTAIEFNFDQPSEALGGKTPMDYAFEELEARAAAEAQLAGHPVNDIYESYKADPYGIVPQFIDVIIKHKETTGKDFPLDYLTPDSRKWALTERRALEDAYKDVETIPYHPHEYDEEGNLIMAEEQAEEAEVVEPVKEGTPQPVEETTESSEKEDKFSSLLNSARAIREANAKQKQPVSAETAQETVSTADVEGGLVFSLSRNNKATVESWLAKREDLPEAQREEVVNYIDGLTDAKTQLATARWFTNGTIRIPEDMKKVEQAISVAGKAKVDPLRYSSPMELLDAHAEFKPTEERINPDDVPTLHRAAEYPDGVVVYDVDGTEKSRQNMRKIINTHFGEDASPWCLLQGDGKGNLTPESKRYWGHYSAYPKQVAFKDGKLLAFSANDTHTRVWWDRQDSSHYGIPITKKVEGDELGRSADYIIDESGNLSIEPGGHMYRGNKQNGLYEDWSTDGAQILYRGEYKNGEVDGVEETWFPNGQMQSRSHIKNGKYFGRYESWYENGQQRLIVEFDENGDRHGTQRGWYKDGKLQEEFHYNHGQLDGEQRDYDDDGDLTSVRRYNNGNLVGFEDHGPFGIEKRVTYTSDSNNHRVVELFRRNGNLSERAEYNGTTLNGVREFYDANGGIQTRENYVYGDRNGLFERYHPNGKLWARGEYKFGNRDGIHEQWDKDGNLVSRVEYRDGTRVRELPLDGPKTVEDFTNDDIVRFSFIGKRGAGELDIADKSGNRLANLSIAEQMEYAGADAQKIKIATGWERGTDGKWRYEMPDLGFDVLEILNFRKGTKRILGDLVSGNNDLLTAYPELAEFTLYGMGAKDPGWGVTNFTRKEIGINVTDIKKYVDSIGNIRETLAHEVQHVIQDIEGFATGGSMRATVESPIINRLRSEKPDAFRMMQIFRSTPFSVLVKFGRDKTMALLDSAIKHPERFKWNEEQTKTAELLLEDLRNTDELGFRVIVQNMSTAFQDATKQARSEYQRMAGEVEARNVEKRLNMSEEERRKSLASETEDVKRIHQIVRFRNSDVQKVEEVSDVDSDGESGIRFSLRTAEPPVKTKKVYKLMRLGEDGKLYPLYIDSANPVELKTWYDADSPDLSMLQKMPSGVFLVDYEKGTYVSIEDYKKERGQKVTKMPNADDINEATKNGLRWMRITDSKSKNPRYKEARLYDNIGIDGTGKVSTYAMRPGWHAGELPTMRQIGLGPKDAEVKYRDDRFVWVEGYIPDDVDYNEEAQSNPGQDIPTHIPTNGNYLKATNADKKASQADRVGWYVAGSFYADHIMSDAESKAVIDEHNAKPENQDKPKVAYDWPRQNNRVFNADTMQLEETPEDWRHLQFSFIGESGAARADLQSPIGKRMVKVEIPKPGVINKFLNRKETVEIEETVTRLGNLDVAKQMEEAGKKAADIKIATGWEKGKDGKWRYEESDVSLNEEFIKEQAKKSRDELKNTLYPISQILVHDEAYDLLMAAYPKIATIKVSLYNDSLFDIFDATRGYYDETRNRLMLNPRKTGLFGGDTNIEELRSTTLHELQHVIQKQEGFAKGGNTNVVDKYGRIPAMEREKDKLDDRKNDIIDADQQIQDLRAEYDRLHAPAGKYAEWSEKLEKARNAGEWNRIWAQRPEYETVGTKEELSEIGDKIQKRREEVLDSSEEAKAILKERKELSNAIREERYRLYRAIAGEVEARNVQTRANMSAEERRNTTAESTEDVPRLEQIILRDKRISTSEEPGVSFSLKGTPEENKELFDKAKERFGTTRDLREAGYVLPDGTMLDFSGRHMASGDTSYLNGGRTVDHRDIEDLNFETDLNTPSGTETSMPDFIQRGAIRIDSNGLINLSVKPTKEQESVLRRLISRNGFMVVDFGDGNSTRAYAEYERPNAERILGDISDYFDYGIKPEGDGGVRFSLANQTQNGFISNAEAALDKIKMDKATPEQWIKMLEKEGGMKAGEDKWLGLSDWLKESDRKTLTKQDISDYIAEHRIQIEEVKYDEAIEKPYADAISSYQKEYQQLVDEGEQKGEYNAFVYAFDEMIERYGDDFGDAFERSGNTIVPSFDYYGEELNDAAKYFLDQRREKTDTRAINTTRLDYTTPGLQNKREIALTVPTIDPWNENDEIHFGDAGEGRAVAWIRFGDTRLESPEKKAVDSYLAEMREKYSAVPGEETDHMTPDEIAHLQELTGREIDNPNSGPRVLVIDEIQSKRHQEGREKGYSEKGLFDGATIGEYKEGPVNQRGKEIIVRNAPILSKDGRKIGTMVDNDGWYYGIRENDPEKNGTSALQSPERILEIMRSVYDRNGIPIAPFEKNWHELAMKRMLRLAAEEGYDKIAWTTGDQQAERYNLGFLLKSIERRDYKGKRIFEVKSNSTNLDHPDFDLTVNDNGLIGWSKNRGFIGKNLSELVGKEMAVRMMSMEDGEIIEGDGLRIGGDGMKGFYDDILPRFMNKYGKKWGVEVEDLELPEVYDEVGHPLVMHSVPVTQEMKDSVMEGQLMFSLTAPNGKESNLSDERYDLVRTEEFKKYFGDWQKSYQLEKIKASEPVSVEKDDYDGKYNLDAKSAQDWILNNLRGEYRIEDTNEQIFLTRVGAEEVTSHSRYDDAHLKSIAVIPKIIKNAIFVEEQTNKKKNDKFDSYRYYVVGMKIDGEDYTAKVVIGVKQGKKYYDHRLTQIEKTRLIDSLNQPAKDFTTAGSASVPPYIGGKDKKLFELLQNNSSKVIDENGEPKVVYHWTNNQFTVFDRSRLGENTDFNAADDEWAKTAHLGFWFSSEHKPDNAGADKEMPVFLNIRNPYRIKSLENLVAELEGFSPDEYVSMRQEEGYDGIIVEDDEEFGGTSYVAFSPSQIKSADPVTYDDNGNVIPLSERFNPENDDIRFSLAPRPATTKEVLSTFDKEGLKGVIGEENVQPLIRAAYAALPKDALRPVVEKAVGDGANVRKHFREYLHDMAYKGTENDETGLLFALIDEIRTMSGNTELTDNDVRYMIWKETSDAKDGDILSLAENIATRNRWSVGEPSDLRFSMSGEFQEATEEAKETMDKKMDDAYEDRKSKLKSFAEEVAPITKVMAAQRTYDRATVDSIIKFAKEIIKNGGVSELTRREVSRLLTLVDNATGKSPKFATRYADQLMDLLLDHIVKDEQAKFMKLVNVKDSSKKQPGVEVQGRLDVMGQITIKAFRSAMGSQLEDIRARMEELSEKMDDKSDSVREEAYAAHAGLKLAEEYILGLKRNEEDEEKMQEELDDAKDARSAGDIGKKAYEEYVKEMQGVIRNNKMERVDLYREFAQRLAQIINGSVGRAKEFREKEQQRIDDIHHDANKDLQGVPTVAHRRDTRLQKILNSDIPRFFLKPLATFDQMLRFLGKKSVTGEGYLYQRYMTQWHDARSNYITGLYEAEDELDKKASEVFGKKMLWSDIYAIERKIEGMEVSFWDGEKMAPYMLTQGNMLYIYMVNKMSDGRMKLRKMGITEEVVEAIKAKLDPRFIELADWIQEEFLPKKRNKYNEVHKRMNGAPMGAIENYFPLKILSDARFEEIDLVNKPNGTMLSSTTTGSIIARRKNSLALDLLHTDAFSLVIEHIEEMEDWAALAEFRRDVNTLLSYRTFKNKVKNMSSIYGSGDTLWKNFETVCSIVTGAYKPATNDRTALNVAKGVTGAKIAFRVNTAIKQLLSFPAYLPDARIDYLIKSMATPGKSWKWCMDNIPMFKYRWMSRQAGDTRLMETDSDWEVWKNNVVQTAARLGMTPNAAVDAITVAMGTKAMYDTKYDQYKKDGYSDEDADKMAKQDATVLYNQSQQSSEDAFVSEMQLERTWLSVTLTTFRNSPMSYQRQLHDAVRVFGRMMKKGYKEQSIDFMTRQGVDRGLNEDDARKAAERKYNRQYVRSAAKVAVFGYGLQLLWKLGSDVWYLLFGDDDDEKKKIMEEAALAELAGPFEGFAGGDVISNITSAWASDDSLKNVGLSQLPVVSDIEKLIQEWDYDKPRAICDIIDLLFQAGVGVNPETLSDTVIAVIDACNGDLDTAKEFGILMMRILQVPQSSTEKLIIDEIDLDAASARKMATDKLAKRYAQYKFLRNSPYTWWLYDEADKEKKLKTLEKSFEQKVKDRMELSRENGEDVPPTLDEAYKDIKKELSEFGRQLNRAVKDEDKVTEKALKEQPEYKKYKVYKEYLTTINRLDRGIKDTKDEDLRNEWKNDRDATIEELIEKLSKIK